MTNTLSGPAGPPRDSPGSSGLTPPQALDAERAVLAALLLDRDAVGLAIEMLDVDSFYRVAHQKIYDAIVVLYNRNERADLVTLGEELRKRGDLEAIGGPPAISQILEYATTAANLEQHLRLIRSKAILRDLIKATSEIMQEAYAGAEDTPEILDRAEERIFAITDERIREGFHHIRDLLKPAFEHIEALSKRNERITGVPSGYDDLDNITAGFQNSDLIIIAGRPAMGKTSCAMNIAENAAIKARVPVGIFSLEMSKDQLVQRLLCSQGGVALHRVRSGQLSHEDWPRLTTAAGLLTRAPIMIDDSASLSLMEIRAKCRRLKAEKQLGLVVIDYLQLIRPSHTAENRVQEIGQITRGLKALAKELNLPVIALSQLSRAVETRDKSGRPQLSDLRESGCLTADTRILRADTGAEVTMGELLAGGARNIPVWTLDDDLRLAKGTMTHVFPSGTKPVFELKLASGLTVKASANHPFYTLDGWQPLDRLRAGMRLAAVSPIPYSESASEIFAIATGTHAPSRDHLSRVATLVADPRLERVAGSGVFWDAIVSIEPLGEQPVFDATVPGTHNFIANGIIAHNSIEQDADVVMFVYREEVYKPDTAEKGKALIMVAKQRNGPTGDIPLTFLRESTKFVPYTPVMIGETEGAF